MTLNAPSSQNTYENLPELVELERLMETGHRFIRSSVVSTITSNNLKLPIYTLEMGSNRPSSPVLGLFGGVHGVERIGSQVILSFLATLLHRLTWDPMLHEQLEHIRLVFMPIINPGGMSQNTRCNPNGVDLMRNAPISAMDKVPFLIGGHRISRHLPWFRGRQGDEMEAEALALCQVVKERLMTQPFSISLDCHSGFGIKDRVWFPYARTFKPIPDLATAFQLQNLFFQSYPNHHFYIFEPQSQSYTTHGDLWDYLYDEGGDIAGKHRYLPLTLEMGSWTWVKKNPRQLFNFFSLFNPVKPHRHARILRRHIVLFEFLMSACRSHINWVSKDPTVNRLDEQKAIEMWYDHAN